MGLFVSHRAENVSPKTSAGQGPKPESKFMLVHELMKALNSVKSVHYGRNSKKLTVQEMRTCLLLPQVGHSPVPNWRPYWSRLPLRAAGTREAKVLRTCFRGGGGASRATGTGSKESAL